MGQRLDKGELVTLKASDRTVVVADSGRYWLTRSGDPQDYFLVGGEALALRRGRWLVEALDGGVVRWIGREPQKLSLPGVGHEAYRLSPLSRV